VKILIVDDHALVREGLRQVLKGLDEAVEVLDAPTCARAFAHADAHADLDLVLLDYHLPDMDGLTALGLLRQSHPELPVFVLSGSASPQIMTQVLARGAAGYMTKSSMSEELLVALRQVLNGDVYVPAGFGSAEPAAVMPSLAPSTAPSTAPSPAPPLAPIFTPRQLQVLQHLLDGLSNRQIAQRMGLSTDTVKDHLGAIMRGFGVQTRTQAALAANRQGYGSSAQG
jgi:DNA-binding NarL/FixJ family response regulator